MTKVDRGTLLSLENPRYKELVERYDHLKEVTMDDVDEKEELPVHLILGTNEIPVQVAVELVFEISSSVSKNILKI